MAELDDLESFGRRLKVEVCVHCGQNSDVALTTVVELEDYQDKVKCSLHLKDIIDILRRAIPLMELKDEDQNYSKETPEVGVAKDGKLTLLPRKFTIAKAGQEDLKKALKLDEHTEPGKKT
jgi:hypothetical protein